MESKRLIIQNFCLETWALGNRKIVPLSRTNRRLRFYKRTHHVGKLDPEDLPALPAENLNRAQFAERYLRTMVNQKYRNLTCTKSNPSILLGQPYFDQLKKRLANTGHIASFTDFLDAFV